MINYLWAIMIIIGILYAALTGNMAEISNAAIDASKEAITLCITMTGVMALWVGLMQIAESAGIIKSLTKGLRPFVSFLFPRVPNDHASLQYISTNLIANFLGLGWAATPAGLKAMEELSNLETQRNQGKKTHVASHEMCCFLILNISSLQLIPVNMIAYRSQYGSVNPTAIILPAILATSISSIAAIVFIKLAEGCCTTKKNCRLHFRLPRGRFRSHNGGKR